MKKDNDLAALPVRVGRRSFCAFLSLLMLTLAVCLPGCGARRVQLTDEQQDMVEVAMDNREVWKKYHRYGSDQAACNLVYMWESDGNVYLAAGYNSQTSEGATDQGFKMSSFVALMNCYVIAADGLEETGFSQDDRYQWMKHGVAIDQNRMSDEELRGALEESYENSLSLKK